MKKLTISLASIAILVSLVSFIYPTQKVAPQKEQNLKATAHSGEYVKYVYCIGREQAKSGDKNQPVVTNVFKFTCEDEHYPKDYIILGEFENYYNAFYKAKRNTLHMKDELKFMYDTYNEAVKGRREKIAKYVNNGDDPLLIDKFSVSCED